MKFNLNTILKITIGWVLVTTPLLLFVDSKILHVAILIANISFGAIIAYLVWKGKVYTINKAGGTD